MPMFARFLALSLFFVPLASAGPTVEPGPVPITLNGHTLTSEGVGIGGTQAGIRVSTLAQLVNGSTKLEPRLTKTGTTLKTATTGACDTCKLHVVSGGTVTSGLLTVEGVDIVLGEDLARALGGKGIRKDGAFQITAPSDGGILRCTGRCS